MSSAGRAGCSQHASVRFLSDEQLGRKFATASILVHRHLMLSTSLIGIGNDI